MDQGAGTAVTPEDDVEPTDAWAALEALYRAQQAPMVRLAHLLVGDRAVAEELVQDAFVRVLPRLAGVDDAVAYLRTTVVNLCRGHGRRQMTGRRHDAGLAPLATAAPPDLPRDLDEVWIALGTLPEKRRAALVLRYYADLSTDQVARTLQVRPATARSLIRRGLASLKEALT